MNVTVCFVLFLKNDGQGFVLIVIGSLTFIPGSYHTWLAYNAHKGRRGFSYSDIPTLE